MDWGAIAAMGMTVIIIGLVLRMGKSSIPLANIASTGVVNETNALTLANAKFYGP